MKRTSILADESVLLELKHLAKQEGRPVSELVREALATYCAQPRPKKTLGFVGAGRSGRKDVSRRDEELLRKGLGRKI